MPVRSSVDEPADFLASINMNDLYTGSGSECLLSDDIWKKFELEADDLANGFDDCFLGLDDTDYLSDLYPMLDCVIRNHDCMWAGHCASKEHATAEEKSEKLPTQGVWKAPVQRQPVLPGRSVLLKPPMKTPVAASPDSPPMSDDEEAKAKPPTTMVQIINDAIEACDNIDEDSDLNEYFEDGEDEDIIRDPKDEEEEEEEDDEDEDEEQAASVARYAGENDHCYFMDKNAYGRVNGLGIDTPSDSGEFCLLLYIFMFDKCINTLTRSRANIICLFFGYFIGLCLYKRVLHPLLQSTNDLVCFLLHFYLCRSV